MQKSTNTPNDNTLDDNALDDDSITDHTGSTAAGASQRSARGPRLSAADKQQRNSYLREFIPAIVTFWIALAVVFNTVDANTSGARLWVLVPVLPMVGVAVALYRAVQRADEYGRIVMLECMALGFGASMITSMALGFLGGIGVAWTFGGWLVFGVGMTAWSMTLLIRGIR